jgi:hypothetical protein
VGEITHKKDFIGFIDLVVFPVAVMLRGIFYFCYEAKHPFKPPHLPQNRFSGHDKYTTRVLIFDAL